MKMESREEVFSFLSKASIFGNLGFFVGAGLSKAVVVGDDGSSKALSWGDLIKIAAENLDLNYKASERIGIGFPEIASLLCKDLSGKHGISYEEAQAQFKSEIARLTGWYPARAQRDEFSVCFDRISPKWLITTNYDLVLECLFVDKGFSLGPGQRLSVPSGTVPIYHLHGVRTNPSSLVITQEDYISLFRPNEYRQIKLALMIKESVTVMLGYGLGDVNVLTALDWSRNVFTSNDESYPSDLIQVLYSSSPCDNPYRDANGVVVLEVSSISSFFMEFLDCLDGMRCRYEVEEGKAKSISENLISADDECVEKFIDDDSFRAKILRDCFERERFLVSAFMIFFQKVMDFVWTRARPKNHFFAYDDGLNVLLDVLNFFTVNNMPPALFESLAASFDRIFWYVGRNSGESFDAYETWERRKNDISKEIVHEWRILAHNARHLNTLGKIDGL